MIPLMPQGVLLRVWDHYIVQGSPLSGNGSYGMREGSGGALDPLRLFIPREIDSASIEGKTLAEILQEHPALAQQLAPVSGILAEILYAHDWALQQGDEIVAPVDVFKRELMKLAASRGLFLPQEVRAA